MLMKKIAAFVVVAGLLVGGEVMAEEFIQDKKVTNIRVRPTRAYAKFEGCNKYAQILLVKDGSPDEYAKAMYSTVLTALVSGKRVEVEFASDCDTTEAHIVYVDLKQ